MLVGYRAFHIPKLLHNFSMLYASTRKSIFACAHLYNALKVHKLLEQTWPVLEMAMSDHADAIFASSVPDNAETIYSRIAHRLNLTRCRQGCGCHKSAFDLNETQIILFELLHSRKERPKLLSQLEDVMMKGAGTRKGQQTINMSNFVPCLAAHLPQHVRSMHLDYAELTQQCSALLGTLHKELDVARDAYFTKEPKMSTDELFDFLRVQAVEEILKDNRDAWMDCSSKQQRHFQGGALLRQAAAVFNRELAKMPLDLPAELAPTSAREPQDPIANP